MGRGQYIRDEIAHHMARMTEGDCLNIDLRDFQEAYPCGWPSIYETHEQSFLSKAIGSGWGIWRVELMMGPEPVYRISKHHADNRRHYVDPDREHLFKKMPDGTLEPRGDE